MVGKNIGAQIIDQFLGGQMVVDIGEPESCGDSAGSADRTQQSGFGNTKCPPSFQHVAGTIMLRFVKRNVGIIPDSISDGIIQMNRLGDWIISGIFDSRHCKINDYF